MFKHFLLMPQDYQIIVITIVFFTGSKKLPNYLFSILITCNSLYVFGKCSILQGHFYIELCTYVRTYQYKLEPLHPILHYLDIVWFLSHLECIHCYMCRWQYFLVRYQITPLVHSQDWASQDKELQKQKF